MEAASYYLCLFLALLLLLRMLREREGDGSVRLPPGPWRLPVIGSLNHLMGKPLVHSAFADLARRLDTPLTYLRLGEVPVVVATSRDAVRDVLWTHNVTFGTWPWSPPLRVMRHMRSFVRRTSRAASREVATTMGTSPNLRT